MYVEELRPYACPVNTETHLCSYTTDQIQNFGLKLGDGNHIIIQDSFLFIQNLLLMDPKHPDSELTH